MSPEVQDCIDQIIDEVRVICPTTVPSIATEKFEDEDAILFLYVPEGLISNIQKKAESASMMLLMSKDVDIAVLVRPLSLLWKANMIGRTNS